MVYPSRLPTEKLIIRYEGVFDFDKLYLAMVEWLKRRKYAFYETTYKHSGLEPGGAEQEIEWVAERDVTPYYKYTINVAWHLWDVKDVEVVEHGQKKKLTKAKLQITFQGAVDIDYKKRWEKSSFLMFLRDLFFKYIIRKEIEGIWYDTLYYRLVRFHTMVRDLLAMEAQSHAYESYLGDNV